MDFMSFINSLKGDALRSLLLKNGISAADLQGVDFNSMEQINALAEKITPELIKKNPFIANLIKQNANLVGDKKEEVVQVIDKL